MMNDFLSEVLIPVCKGNEVGARTFAILFIIADQVLDVLRKPERNSTGVVTCSAGVVEGSLEV